MNIYLYLDVSMENIKNRLFFFDNRLLNHFFNLMLCKIRELDQGEYTLETFVITGPIFDVGSVTKMIGENDSNGIRIRIPVSSHFFKCVLAEEKSGALKM